MIPLIWIFFVADAERRYLRKVEITYKALIQSSYDNYSGDHENKITPSL